VRQLPLKLRKRITEPCRGDRSKALFGVVKMLGERGFSAALIEHVIRAYPKGIGAKHADRADLAQDIARILSKPSQDPAPSTWRAELLYGEGATPRSNLANAIAALRLAPEWRHILGFDLFSQKIVARGKTPWMSAASEDAKAWTDVDDIRTADWLQHQGIFVSPLTAGQATQTVAHDYEFHPVKDYLASLTWDGSPRLDTWLADHFGITPDPKMPDENDHDVAIRHKSQQTYINAVGAKFMISCVARIMQPGCKVDCALIVEGSQGKRKSTAIKTLLPNPAWFTDEIAELGSKDAAMQLTGRWIIELSELESITRADVSRVKAFLSRSTDRFRPPYGHHIVSLPRQCGFIGTVNKNEYLRDETGARRFWTVKSRTTINLAALARDRDQLWAEARERYNKGEPWWLETVELETLAAKEQAARRVQDPWEKPIRHWITGRTHTSCEEILKDVLHLPIDRQDQRAANRVAACLRALDWERYRLGKSIGDGTKRGDWRYRPCN
jgi:predicted P-loop ATPase